MKKLTLNKEVIANLSSQEMNVVKGLTGQTCAGDTCEITVCNDCFTLFLTCGVCVTTSQVCA